jgi:hypothetical protein
MPIAARLRQRTLERRPQEKWQALALRAIMAAEKKLPSGRRLAAPLGTVLLLVALSVAITSTTS